MFVVQSNQTSVAVLVLLVFLAVASTFHLNDQNISSEIVTEFPIGEDGDVTESCDLAVPDLNFPAAFLISRGDHKKPSSLALIEDSKTLQISLLQIARQVANTFKMTNNSASQLKTLAANVENQFHEVNRCLEVYQNSSGDNFHQLIPQPLTNLTESTKRIAQLFYLMATQFEDLFNLTKTVKNSAVKILTKLERAKSGVIRRKASRINSRRKLKMAMQSLRRTIADLTRRLQRDRVELKTTSQEWQSMKPRINFTQDDEWADAKSKFERAKWRWNCSRQALNKTQEKLNKLTQLDEELSTAIEESRQENVEIYEEMVLLFNGTRNGSSNIVQLERHRNLTTDFANYYNDAGSFFLGIGSRISNILAGISIENFDRLKSNLNKIKCDLDRNGRFIILTDGKSPKKDFQRKIVGFVLGGGVNKANNCDDDSKR